MSGYVSPFYLQQFRYANGLPLAGGSITSYSNQTSIPKSLYYDITLQNACPNPLPLDSGGFSPEYYLADGLYTLVIKDSSGNIIATRDYVAGSVSSVDLANISATSAAYKIKIDANDTAPGYIWNKLSATDTIDFTNTGDKIAINVKNPWKVKANIADPTPGYLNEKIMDTDTVILSISANKLRADFAGPTLSTPGYLFSEFQNTDSIDWSLSASKILANVISGKVQVSSGDTLEFLEDKIQAGSGIVFTQSEDINGKQIHISTTNSTTNAGKVKVTSADTLEYLVDKFIAGNGVNISADNNNILISNKNNYYVSAIPYTSALVISSTDDLQFISLNLPAGTWDVTGNALAYHVDNMLGALNDGVNIPFDGYEQFVFSAASNPLGTVSMPIGPKRFVLESPGTIYFMTTVQLVTYTSCLMWGNLQARQIN